VNRSQLRLASLLEGSTASLWVLKEADALCYFAIVLGRVNQGTTCAFHDVCIRYWVASLEGGSVWFASVAVRQPHFVAV
jgi:hypothetical protein